MINGERRFLAVIFDLEELCDIEEGLIEIISETLQPVLHSCKEATPVQPFGLCAPKTLLGQDEFYQYFHGKLRLQGIQDFLESRNINIEMGSLEDEETDLTLCGLANKRANLTKKNLHLFSVRAGAVELLTSLKAAEVQVGIVSWMQVAQEIVAALGIDKLIDCVVDGEVGEGFHLRTLPHLDYFLKACGDLGVSSYETVAVLRGEQMIQEGNFGLVCGIKPRPEDVMRPKQKEFVTDRVPGFMRGFDIVCGSLLELTVEMLQESYVRQLKDFSWRLYFRYWNPEEERVRESLTCVGNGYVCSRGSFEVCTANDVHNPGTYFAGLYNSSVSKVDAVETSFTDMVNCPNWALVEFAIDDDGFCNPLQQEILDYYHEVNVREAYTSRRIEFRDAKGRETRLETQRMISMEKRHHAGVVFKLTPLNYDATVCIRSSIDGNVENVNVPTYKGLNRKHIATVSTERTDGCLLLLAKTVNSSHHVAVACKNTFAVETVCSPRGCDMALVENSGTIAEEFRAFVKQGQRASLEKIVGLFTSRDRILEGETLDPESLKAVALRSVSGFYRYAQLLSGHTQAWRDIWHNLDIKIEGDRFAQHVLRLHTYHLMIAASPHSATIDAGLTARGLTGEAHRGHVFWDDLHSAPFYLSSYPTVVKAHLRYRWNRLPQARIRAKHFGLQGAMYPWQSAESGFEETQKYHLNPLSGQWHPDMSRIQRHVNIAIFYNAWQYLQATNDREFLHSHLAELMLDIAIFWQSASKLESDGRYHVRGSMGPDPFHEKGPDDEIGVSDNAYTNVMVVWVVERAQEILEALDPEVRERLVAKLGLTPEVRTKMADLCTKMHVGVTDEGIIEQFSGFMKLQDLNLSTYKAQYDDVKRLDRILRAEGNNPDDYKICKQCDTLMMYHLLPVSEVGRILRNIGHYTHLENDLEFLRRNFDYYEQRTSNGAIMSYTVHAKIAFLLHQADYAWSWFLEACKADLYDTDGTTGEGVHLAVMGGTIDLVISAFVGLRERSRGGMEIRPALPAHWHKVSFRRLVRGIPFFISVTKSDVRITMEGGVVSEDTGNSEDLPCDLEQQSVPFYVGNNKILPCPFSPITVEHNTIRTLKHFYQLMRRTKYVRQGLVTGYVQSKRITTKNEINLLRHILTALRNAPQEDGVARLLLDDSGRNRVKVNFSYEVSELEKDLFFLENTEEQFVGYLRRLHPDFDRYVDEGVRILGGIQFRNFLTDRDGTTNNYCGRYNSSIQSIYNAIWLTRFAKACTTNACFITSAPLMNPGIVDVSTLPDHLFVFAASKGREFIDVNGVRYSQDLTPEQEQLMHTVNNKLKALVQLPKYEKFSLIGSGLQMKFAQTAIARQDVSKVVRQEESDAFLQTVKGLVAAIDGGRSVLSIHDSGLDIEISPVIDQEKQDETATFHKGKGVEFLNEKLGLEIQTGPNLVCGDTSSDVPMLETCMQYCPNDTYALFVTTDEKLQQQVAAVCPERHFFVPQVDMLVAILDNCAQLMSQPRSPRTLGASF
eukprot:TRINITY_DN2859_c0_g1_i3.p1 TRINITY_DN2859_c0_g1~~TRINITY_DN2859_c0_g1_i3.p1  ORF type:complete len:1522 (+),score=289.37 TRINITY_DN2859_c0_g1_i3:34-4566(+)